MRVAIRGVLTLIVIAVTIASFVNVFGDDAEQRSEALAIACPKGCPGGTQVAIQRSPLGETITYSKPSGAITVKCARAAILVGPWSCEKGD